MVETSSNSVHSSSRLVNCCPDCDYSLDGLPDAGVCPECGGAYDQEMIVLNQCGTREGAARGWIGVVIFVIVFGAIFAWLRLRMAGTSYWYLCFLVVMGVQLARQRLAPHSGVKQLIIGPAGWLRRDCDEGTLLYHLHRVLYPMIWGSMPFFSCRGVSAADRLMQGIGGIVVLGLLAFAFWQYWVALGSEKIPLREQFRRRCRPWNEIWEVDIRPWKEGAAVLQVYGPKAWVGRTELFAMTVEVDVVKLTELRRRINSWIWPGERGSS